MAGGMHEAQLLLPKTWSYQTLEGLLSARDFLASLSFPLIIKSHYSHRGDLVDKVRTIEQLQARASEWSQEPVVLQEFAAGDGWDNKLWIIDQHIFAARRHTPLEANPSREDFPIPPEELPRDWAHIALEIGRVFNMRLFGVDLLITERGPIIVDVNSFPGFAGVPDTAAPLVALVERIAKERKAIA